MTEVSKQLLIDYADGRPVALMARDLRCHPNTLLKRLRESLSEVDNIPDYRRRDAVGIETLAAYWKIKFMQRHTVHARKRIRGAARWSQTLAGRTTVIQRDVA